MILYRLEHTHCPKGKAGHGPATGAPSGECLNFQTFGRFHTGPGGDPLVPERFKPDPCYVCDGKGRPPWAEARCYNCEGRGRERVYIRIKEEQVCGLTREQLPSWAVSGCEPKLTNGWEMVVYRMDGRFRWTRRGEYQVVFRREDADVVGRITTQKELEPLLRPSSADIVNTSLTKALAA